MGTDSPRSAARVFQVDALQALGTFEYERGRMAAIGVELVLGDCTTPAEVIERAHDAEVVWLAWNPPMDRDLMHALPACRLLVRWGVGYDNIDVPAATDLGIAVANAATYGTEDVAEHAIALVLAVARQIVWLQEDIRAGGFSPVRRLPVHRLSSCTLGLLGVGRIGNAVATRARALGLRVIGFDPGRTDEQLRAAAIEPRSFDGLLAEADYVSIHVPLVESTRHLVDDALLSRLKPGATIVNTSRGGVIDEAALVAALDDGRLAAAALDVFEVEPLPATSPLRTHPRVVLTPHVAALSAEGWHSLRQEVCDVTESWLTTGWAPNILNPEIRR